MPDVEVVFLDTSVFATLIRVPGRDQNYEELLAEFYSLVERDVRFVLPITTIIETGNLISNSKGGDARAAAKRFVESIQAAQQESPPWTVQEVSWDDAYLADLVAGDSTGADLIDHLGARHMGAGDISILVERDRFRAGTSYTQVRVWSTDNALRAYRD